MSDLTNNRISNNVPKAVLPTETSTDTVKPVQRTTPIQEPHLCETTNAESTQANSHTVVTV